MVFAGEGNRFTQVEQGLVRVAGDLVKMFILRKLGYATFEEFEGSLLDDLEEVKQGFAECGKRLFETRDALRALVKEGISDENKEEAYQLAREADLIEAELKQLGIRKKIEPEEVGMPSS